MARARSVVSARRGDLLIGAVVCFVLELLGVAANIDLVALGLALGFASFLL